MRILSSDQFGYNYACYWSADNKKKMSVVTLIKSGIKVRDYGEIIPGRALAVEVGYKARIRILNVYAPTIGHPIEWSSWCDSVSRDFTMNSPRSSMIVVGDINAMLSNTDKLTPPAICSEHVTRSSDWGQLVKSLGLTRVPVVAPQVHIQ
eukprot:gene12084-3560_t